MQRNCALALGVIFLLLGIAGFIPGFTSVPGETFNSGIPLDADSIYAKGFNLVLGVFPSNFVHNLLHVAVGVLGIVAASTGNAKLYNQGFAISYALIFAMGLIPVAKTFFGIMPVFGNNIWLNGLTGTIAGYYGFLGKDPEVSTDRINV